MFYQLKTVRRLNSVLDRKESPAEHTWSALVLADHFLEKQNGADKLNNLDRLKVFELLLYHDVVEIEAGDTPLHPEHTGERPDEIAAMRTLVKKLPIGQAEKALALFLEYEEQKSHEAKFAKAIDQLDAIIHELDHKQDWKGWTEEYLREKKSVFFKEFPEIMEMFEECIEYSKEHRFYRQ